MTLSRRHHYVPQFLIKHFCDTDDKVWVYDKKQQRLMKNKQSPKSVFFEMGRNLSQVNGETVDNIEKMYGEVDDLLAKTVEKVLRTHTMIGRELTLLILLATLTKWRIPQVDPHFDKLADQFRIEELGLAIRPVDKGATMTEEIANKLENQEIVKATKRLLFPLQPIVNDDALTDIHKNCFLVEFDEWPALLGDCPLIETTQASEFKNLGDFIFPLSSTVTLICKRNAEKYISNKLFYIQRDLTIFHLSKQYVACKNKEHLMNVVQMYENVAKEEKTHLLAKYVFEFVV